MVKVGELALKGLNRRTFEDILIKNIKRRLAPLGRFEIKNAQSAIYIEPQDANMDLEEAAERLGTVFGIAAYSRACVAQKDMEDIKARALEYLADELDVVKTFKVEAKRSDKRFALQSPQICAQLGGSDFAEISACMRGCTSPGSYRHSRDTRFWRLYQGRRVKRRRRYSRWNRGQGGYIDQRRY